MNGVTINYFKGDYPFEDKIKNLQFDVKNHNKQFLNNDLKKIVVFQDKKNIQETEKIIKNSNENTKKRFFNQIGENEDEDKENILNFNKKICLEEKNNKEKESDKTDFNEFEIEEIFKKEEIEEGEAVRGEEGNLQTEKNEDSSFRNCSYKEEFFINKEPDHWYALYENEGKICLEISDEIERISKKIIYIFKNKTDQKLLIGKTGTTFSARMSGYLTVFNKTKESLSQSDGEDEEIEFAQAVCKDPSNFEVGILYVLDADESLNNFETLFIDYKAKGHALYNKRRGGAGGLARSEEKKFQYGIPKFAEQLTPIKYYLIKQNNKTGEIKLLLSPGADQYRRQETPGQGLLYVIKNMTTKKRYIGATQQKYPPNRFNQHLNRSESFNPNHPTKYNPNKKDGRIHPAIGKNPEQFGANFLPIIDASSLSEEEKKNYIIVDTIGKVEKLAIEMKKSHFSQNGYNCNKGGGGPISDPDKHRKSIKGHDLR